MTVIVLILMVSLFIAGIFLLAFIWSVKNNQFDDEKSSAQRILFNNETKMNNQ